MPVVPIVVDMSDLARQFMISPKQVEEVCDNMAKTMAARYAQVLEKTAQRDLKQTKSRYIHNIKVIDTGRMEGTVMLDFSKDKLVAMLELGASPFDIKKGLLDSPNAHVGKNGKKYATVPFRWGTPGAVAESDVFSGTMPKAIYNAVRSLNQNIIIAGGGMRTAGLSVNDIPQKLQQVMTRRAIQDSAGKVLFKQYEHKTSLYQGIIRQSDPTTGQNRYFSFRRVSDNSDPEAFIHPGIQQYNLIQKALSGFNQQEELSNALDLEWQRLGY